MTAAKEVTGTMTNIREIEKWADMTDGQKRRLVENLAFLCNRIVYRISKTIKHTPINEIDEEEREDGNCLAIASHVADAILGGEDDEELLDEFFGGAKVCRDWLMADDFCVAKVVE